MKYRAPLGDEDAAAIEHALEYYTLRTADAMSSIDDTVRYGILRGAVRRLLMGEEAEIEDPLLADSRSIVRRVQERERRG